MPGSPKWLAGHLGLLIEYGLRREVPLGAGVFDIRRIRPPQTEFLLIKLFCDKIITMKKLLVANWKMNPATEREAVVLARASDRKNVVICPPLVYVSSVKGQVSKAKVGAQDVFCEEKGAYTGEISPAMLKNLGVKYVIIGHSERRKWLHETDEMINKKIKAALKAGLKVILCVGEPWPVRKKGLAAAKQFVKAQLKKDLKFLHSNSYILNSRLIVAYEPIWAIGTGRADKPADAVEMSKFIKNLLRVPVLYGGSVDGKNAENFLKYKEINGALVGGASLKAGEFNKIIKIASKYG